MRVHGTPEKVSFAVGIEWSRNGINSASAGEQLNQTLDSYLGNVPSTTDDNTPYPIKGTKAIIGP